MVSPIAHGIVRFQARHVLAALMMVGVAFCGLSCKVNSLAISSEKADGLEQASSAPLIDGPVLLGPAGRFVFGRENLARRVVHSWHELGFDLVSYEYSPYDGIQHRWTLQNPTSFGVECVSASHANELVVAGQNRQGETVIELWRYPPQQGAWSTSTAGSGTIGTPLPLTSPVATLGSYAWISPSDRDPQAPARRAELYEGSGIGDVEELLADPEGRFVLVVERGSNSVYQAPTDGTGTIQVLYDGVTDPHEELGDSPQCRILQSGFDDRLYIIGAELGPNEGYGLVFLDPNNDGVFDSPVWLDPVGLEALAPPAVWEDFSFTTID